MGSFRQADLQAISDSTSMVTSMTLTPSCPSSLPLHILQVGPVSSVTQPALQLDRALQERKSSHTLGSGKLAGPVWVKNKHSGLAIQSAQAVNIYQTLA